MSSADTNELKTSDVSTTTSAETKSTSSKHQSSVDPFGTSTLGKQYNEYDKLSAESDTELLRYLAELITINAKAYAIVTSKFDSEESSPEKTEMLNKVNDFKQSLDTSLKLLNEFVIAKKKLTDQLTILRHAEAVKIVLDEERSTEASAKSADA